MMRSPKHLTPSLKIAFTLSESDCSFSISIFRCQSDLHFFTVSFSRIALSRNRFLTAVLATTLMIISNPIVFVNTFLSLFFGLTSLHCFSSYLEFSAEHYSCWYQFLLLYIRTFTSICAFLFDTIFGSHRATRQKFLWKNLEDYNTYAIKKIAKRFSLR